MSENFSREGLAIFVAALSMAGLAGVRLGTPFADGMVLQRDREVAVWGTAEPSEKVSVSFADATVETVADTNGAWRVKLPKMAASKEGRELVAAGKNRVVVRDVLVGEVWYCAGQSNTEMPLVGDNPHFSDRIGRLTAQMTRKPFVRFCYASNYRWSVAPKATADYKVEWKRCERVNLEKAPSFSAMGVYFALELFSALDVPVGIVGSYWGGTNIDAWTPRCGYEGKSELAETAAYEVHDQAGWKDELKKGAISAAQQQPTVLWNEMVAPWCPMTMRGFIWYQGCHNRADGALYRAKMHALYDGWARSFENPELKLYFVQLAPFSCSWYEVQLAQAAFAAEEKNAGMAVTCDVGNNDDVHPWEKGTVAKRLAAMALSRDYGFSDIVADAPTLRGCLSDEGRIILRFDHADGWYVYNPDWTTGVPFEIAGTNGVWTAARLVNSNGGRTSPQIWVTKGCVEGRDLVLEAEGVEKPVKVRYLYQKPWRGNVYATSGLPLGPFEAEAK